MYAQKRVYTRARQPASLRVSRENGKNTLSNRTRHNDDWRMIIVGRLHRPTKRMYLEYEANCKPNQTVTVLSSRQTLYKIYIVFGIKKKNPLRTALNKNH